METMTNAITSKRIVCQRDMWLIISRHIREMLLTDTRVLPLLPPTPWI